MHVMLPAAYAATTLTYQYDANGNLISGDGKYYEYNDANQLVKVRHGDQNGPVIAEYAYDHTGQRIKKSEDGVTTYYIGKHYETQISGDARSNTSYYFANGERVAKKDPSGSMFYYHSDHLGGTNAITDSSGNLVERTRYYPFGEIRLGGNEKYLYTGKEKDQLTDWYYYEARYYNSDFKHFTQADTVEPDYYDPQDLNRYAYVGNNPLRFVDPTGNRKDEDKRRDWEKILMKFTKKLADAPNWKVIRVKGHLRQGKWVKARWRRAPNALKSGAAGKWGSSFSLLLDPTLQAIEDWERNDLRGGQKTGRYSLAVLEAAVFPLGLADAGAQVIFGSEKVDQFKADIFSERNPIVDKGAIMTRAVGGARFDKWLVRQQWLDAF